MLRRLLAARRPGCRRGLGHQVSASILAQQAEVFREFHQLGNPERDWRNGLGLGLSIAHGLARTLGHDLSLASDLTRQRLPPGPADLDRGAALRGGAGPGAQRALRGFAEGAGPGHRRRRGRAAGHAGTDGGLGLDCDAAESGSRRPWPGSRSRRRPCRQRLSPARIAHGRRGHRRAPGARTPDPGPADHGRHRARAPARGARQRGAVAAQAGLAQRSSSG